MSNEIETLVESTSAVAALLQSTRRLLADEQARTRSLTGERDAANARIASLEAGRAEFATWMTDERTRTETAMAEAKIAMARAEAKVEQSVSLLAQARSIAGVESEDMLAALDAGNMALLPMSARRERAAYLRRRGWRMESETSWVRDESNDRAPFELAAKQQIANDLAPFAKMATAELQTT